MKTIDQLLAGLETWKSRRIVVAMSGGVDSALSAALLHMAGAEVIGVHMRTWHYNDTSCSLDRKKGLATCCSPLDAKDARHVADQFGFPFYAMDFQVNFRQSVIDPFIEDYLNGRTPNPCVNCNNSLKLGSLLAKGKAYGAEAVATGHYGCLSDNPETGRRELRVAKDLNKDQTYYLFGLLQSQLAKMEMPLGSITKDQARELARQLGIRLHDKPDSYEICFVTDNNYRRFIRDEAGIDESQYAGAIVNTRGEVLGEHQGIHNYTIGQRKGLGISAPHPLYVVDLIPETHTVIVGNEDDILAPGLLMNRVNWVSRAETTEPYRAMVKIRYRHMGEPATIHPDPNDLSRAWVVFDQPARAVTPGQAAVVYDDPRTGRVECGGWIVRRLMDEDIAEIQRTRNHSASPACS